MTGAESKDSAVCCRALAQVRSIGLLSAARGNIMSFSVWEPFLCRANEPPAEVKCRRNTGGVAMRRRLGAWRWRR